MWLKYRGRYKNVRYYLYCSVNTIFVIVLFLLLLLLKFSLISLQAAHAAAAMKPPSLTLMHYYYVVMKNHTLKSLVKLLMLHLIGFEVIML